jgi:hypothetical protein
MTTIAAEQIRATVIGHAVAPNKHRVGPFDAQAAFAVTDVANVKVRCELTLAIDLTVDGRNPRACATARAAEALTGTLYGDVRERLQVLQSDMWREGLVTDSKAARDLAAIIRDLTPHP